MSWMRRLCEAYDYAKGRGAVFDETNPLPEIGFKYERVQAEIRLTKGGDFFDIEFFTEEKQISVPATVESIFARGNPVKPHPIFDKVKNFTLEQLAILEKWVQTEDVHEDVVTIYNYLSKKSIKEDIEKHIENIGKKVKSISDLFVCFKVDCSLYNRSDFIESWHKYFMNSLEDDGREYEYCYITGEKEIAARKHPSALATAILISMTDENCLGRFNGSADKAVSVGLITTLKAHNALKWLINRQGKMIYGMEVVIWDSQDFNAVNSISPWENVQYDADDIYTGEVDGEKIASAASGLYSKKIKELTEYSFNELSSIVSISVDASCRGRASITHYQEFEPHEYINNLLHWYRGCVWWKQSKGKVEIFTPALYEICDLIYGKGSDGNLVKLKKNLAKELIPCITAGKALPGNLISAAYGRIINPQSFKDSKRKDEYAWGNAVSVLCALINKKESEKGGITNMNFENENDRDFLYGRLLAIADIIENKAMNGRDNSDANRTTNAERYMSRFVQCPAECWMMFRTQLLLPYLNRLDVKTRSYYVWLMDEIQSRISFVDNIDNNKSLKPRFLQGYSCQKLNKFKKNDEE